MPGWKTWEKLLESFEVATEDPVIVKMQEAMDASFARRQAQMCAIKKELAAHFSIPENTELSKRIAWILTSDRWS